MTGRLRLLIAGLAGVVVAAVVAVVVINPFSPRRRARCPRLRRG